MIEKVRKTIREQVLIKKGDTVIVGASGGLDSQALMYILTMLREELECQLWIVHLNHMLRGQEADEDELFVKFEAEKLGLVFYSKRQSVDMMAKIWHMGLEEAGRTMRYAYFHTILQKAGEGKIAVAHHLNDQAETIFMRILRGTGLDGLRGMDYQNGPVIRPLLSCTREEISDFVRENQIAYRVDKSNYSLDYQRNRIRLETIPYLEKAFHPGVSQALFRLGELVKLDVDYLKQQTESAYQQIVKIHHHYVSLERKPFFILMPALQRRLLRLLIDRLSGSLQNIQYDQMESLLQLIHGSVGKTMDLRNLKFVVNYNAILIYQKDYPINQPPYSYALVLNGILDLPNCGFQIQSQLIDQQEFAHLVLDNQVVCFDYDQLKSPLLIRNRRKGDHFLPFGLLGSKKLKDLLIDEKIPRSLRNDIPLLVSGDEILWVAGVRRSRLYPVTNETRQILKLKLLRLPE